MDKMLLETLKLIKKECKARALDALYMLISFLDLDCANEKDIFTAKEINTAIAWVMDILNKN